VKEAKPKNTVATGEAKIKNTVATGEAKIGTLLDGDYDPEVSEASFQDALLQWRSGNVSVSSVVEPAVMSNVQSIVVAGEDIETQTESLKERVAIGVVEESYFDKLKRSKMIDGGAITNRNNLDQKVDLGLIAVPDLENIEKLDYHESNPKLSHKPDHQWDESDEEALQEIFAKSKTITLSNPPPAPSSALQQQWTLTCTDITNDEEDVIMDALSRGIMVECIASSKLSVILA
jgi:hypothetical protein